MYGDKVYATPSRRLTGLLHPLFLYLYIIFIPRVHVLWRWSPTLVASRLTHGLYLLMQVDVRRESNCSL